MWMFPRNIRRIEPWKLVQISKLIAACTGDLVSQDVQDQLYLQLQELGVKAEKNQAGVSNSGGLRTYLAQLACLGFFWRDASGSYRTTRAGELLMDGDQPLKVLRCQLLRMQYPSVYGSGPMVRISPAMSVKPFVFLVRLLQDKRLGGWLTCTDIAVPVVYGRTFSDYEKCVRLILQVREADEGLDPVIKSVDDLRTPRRFHADNPKDDFQKGIEDALTIANTAKNYLLAAQIIAESPDFKGRFLLTGLPEVQAEIAKWMAEGDEVKPIERGCEAAWQQHYGRYDQTKAVRSLSQRRINGFQAMLQSQYIAAAEAAPFEFDHGAFIKAQAQRWGKTEAEIAVLIDSLKARVPTIERDVVTRAASSGGQQSLVFEKAAAALFRKLGFDSSVQIGQRRAKREGGYPDIWIKSSAMKESAFADTKATQRYDFPLGDTAKLAAYYKNCWTEIDASSPAAFFLYIAGGFGRSPGALARSLASCAEKYGKPVSALTASALLDLAALPERPSPEKLWRAFQSGAIFASAESIVSACGYD